jgi:hypothetical protein
VPSSFAPLCNSLHPVSKVAVGVRWDRFEARRFCDVTRRLGRARGSFGTRAIVTTGSADRAPLSTVPGRALELSHAAPLIARLSGISLRIVGRNDYPSHAVRKHVWHLGTQRAIPFKRNEALVNCLE